MNDGGTIGKAFAGHAYRDSGHKMADEYGNMLTCFVDSIIQKTKAKIDCQHSWSLPDPEHPENVQICYRCQAVRSCKPTHPKPEYVPDYQI